MSGAVVYSTLGVGMALREDQEYPRQMIRRGGCCHRGDRGTRGNRMVGKLDIIVPVENCGFIIIAN